MQQRRLSIVFTLAAVLLCHLKVTAESSDSALLGKFDKTKDLYLAHFDLKTDVDDVHSVAAVATMLADRRLAGVSFHAVAGAYGIQKGAYVPANELFEVAFGKHWSDAHADWDKAVTEVSNLAIETLRSNGSIWIADGGQSDFSAAVIRKIQAHMPDEQLKSRIHVVQHADWNEEVTTKADLDYVKKTASYHRIASGNAVGNGTPGLRSDHPVDWEQHVTDPKLNAMWHKAIAIADKYNGADGRYLNKSIKTGGLDFSDAIETTWIFGFNALVDAEDFFKKFSTREIKVEGNTKLHD